MQSAVLAFISVTNIHLYVSTLHTCIKYLTISASFAFPRNFGFGNWIPEVTLARKAGTGDFWIFQEMFGAFLATTTQYQLMGLLSCVSYPHP